MFDIWNSPQVEAEKAYEEDNFSIQQGAGGYCVVYCSSNNIWFPNTREAFLSDIVEKNRFEWTYIRCRRAKKEIFVRDIYKSWYVTGINQKIDNIDSLASFISDMSDGLEIVCIGSSAGGYLAALLGSLLNAKYVIAFSAQFELKNRWAMEVNPFLKKYESDPHRNKYYDLKPIIESSSTPIYYIAPCKSEQDIYHMRHIKNVRNVKTIALKSSHHGVVMLKDNVKVFISLSLDELERLYSFFRGKETSRFSFSVKLVGMGDTLLALKNEAIRLFSRVLNK